MTTFLTTHVSCDPGRDWFWGRHVVIAITQDVTAPQVEAIQRELQKIEVEYAADPPTLQHFKSALAAAGFPNAIVAFAMPIQSQPV